ncbi:MAG: hypothetical protein B7Z80_01910 [Rhodospirillales bacterium 20-64-7]|nr:MAG: hypothetical protein B7Z80_01910 [Rhodospirillales bacterium 20-64-7]HQT75776.1 DUF692 domain-containing protein [Rhodopila sp.]
MTGTKQAACAGIGSVPVSAGIGLRFPHHTAFFETSPKVGWIEVHSENYLTGPALTILEAVRTDYPVSLHSVGLSLGSAQGVDRRHLARIADLADRVDPGLMSDHLAWGAVDHDFLADLLPLPLTEESLDVVCRNVDLVQTTLKRSILIENPSTYLQFRHSTIPEPEFLTALVQRTGCGLICDINNIFVSCTNHGWDAERYLGAFAAAAVGEYHLAGHSPAEGIAEVLLLDTHDRQVDPAVWTLFATALRIIGPRPALIEWDAAIPDLSVLLHEAAIADHYLMRHNPGARHAHAA